MWTETWVHFLLSVPSSTSTLEPEKDNKLLQEVADSSEICEPLSEIRIMFSCHFAFVRLPPILISALASLTN